MVELVQKGNVLRHIYGHSGNPWSELADQGIELAVCIASAIKRGVLNAEEQARYEKTSHTLAPGFELVGLGQLVAGIQYADRYIEFPQ